MKSKISPVPPATCGDCEFYQEQARCRGQASGLCLWRMATVHHRWLACTDRTNSPLDKLKRQLIIASQNYLTPPARRKAHADPRQDSLL